MSRAPRGRSRGSAGLRRPRRWRGPRASLRSTLTPRPSSGAAWRTPRSGSGRHRDGPHLARRERSVAEVLHQHSVEAGVAEDAGVLGGVGGDPSQISGEPGAAWERLEVNHADERGNAPRATSVRCRHHLRWASQSSPLPDPRSSARARRPGPRTLLPARARRRASPPLPRVAPRRAARGWAPGARAGSASPIPPAGAVVAVVAAIAGLAPGGRTLMLGRPLPRGERLTLALGRLRDPPRGASVPAGLKSRSPSVPLTWKR